MARQRYRKLVEGFDVLEKTNDAFIDDQCLPLKDNRIRHTVSPFLMILEGLVELVGSQSLLETSAFQLEEAGCFFFFFFLV